jgi:ATP-binding cassette subfamily B protein
MFVIVSKATASAERIDRVFKGEDETSFLLVPALKEKEKEISFLEFDHVSFSYDGTGNHLRDISFRVEKGETLGIIGATGSGKSTVVNLLLRYYDPNEGTIRINGRDIRGMSLKDLRSRFGTVFQNDVIFEESIFENIRMGRNISEKDAVDAAGYARALDFIGEKGGILESLNIRGANLSGGQKQRILIARALAAHPEILVLDDSSSALDYKTDSQLRRELKENFSRTTCILIAQRVSSVMNLNQILVLDEGAVIGQGTHEELMKTCEGYREIVTSQMGSEGNV